MSKNKMNVSRETNEMNSNGALAALGNYGSSSESDDEHEPVQYNSTNKTDISHQRLELPTANISKSQSSPIGNLTQEANIDDIVESQESLMTYDLVCGIVSDTVDAQEKLPSTESFHIPQAQRDKKRMNSLSSSCSSDSASSSSSASDDSSSAEEVSDEEEESNTASPQTQKCSKKSPNKKQGNDLKVKGELSNSDLPPIEDLHISVPEYECVPLGEVSSIVDDLVVVRALPNTPALDLESVLFLDKGKRPLGKVFDVIGPVTSPFYCVRFNSNDHIKSSEVEKELKVYCAPRTEHTSFVFVEQLRKIKGSDASWKDDIEPQNEHVEYSDDEQERAARKSKKKQAQNQQTDGIDNDITERCEPNHGERKFLKAKRAYRPPNPSQQSSNAFYRNTKRYNHNRNERVQWNSIPPRSSFTDARTFDRDTLPPFGGPQSQMRASTDSHQFHAKQSYNLANNQQVKNIDFSIPPPLQPNHMGQMYNEYQQMTPTQVHQISSDPVSYHSNLSHHPSAPNNTFQNTHLSYTNFAPTRHQEQGFNNPQAQPSTTTRRDLHFQQNLSQPPPPPPLSRRDDFQSLNVYHSNINPTDDNLHPPGT